MMNKKLFSLIAISFILFSCKDDDEVNPDVLTQNHWVKVIEDTHADPPIELVYSIDFGASGKVYYEAFFREPETKVLLGYLEYFNGTYQIVNKKVEVTIQKHYNVQGVNKLYLDKDDLTIIDREAYTREFELRNSNSELHTIMPLYASSLGIIYDREAK